MPELAGGVIYPLALAFALGFFFLRQTLSFLTKAQSFGL
jgi:hypothetical protein